MAFQRDNSSSGGDRSGSGNRGGARGGNQNAKKPRPNKTREATKRQSMLNTHKVNPFKYDMNEILRETQMDDAKASRQSTKEAKEFVRTYLDSEDLTKDEHDRICKLLDKYSKYR